MARLKLVSGGSQSPWRRPPPVKRQWWRAKTLPPGGYFVPVAAICALVVVAWLWSLPTPAVSVAYGVSPAAGAAITVIDGDTVRVDGRTTRLVGFNAPETWQPRCAAEKQLGDHAASRLRALVTGGDIAIAGVACACPPGTEGTDACNFGRACATLSVGGQDVGAILVGEGLAVPFVCRGSGCPPTPRPCG